MHIKKQQHVRLYNKTTTKLQTNTPYHCISYNTHLYNNTIKYKKMSIQIKT